MAKKQQNSGFTALLVVAGKACFTLLKERHSLKHIQVTRNQVKIFIDYSPRCEQLGGQYVSVIGDHRGRFYLMETYIQGACVTWMKPLEARHDRKKG